MSLEQIDERTPVFGHYSFNSSYVAHTEVDVVPDPANVWRLDSLIGTNFDSVDHTMSVIVHQGTDSYYLATVTIPAGSGKGATPPVDVLGQVMGTAEHYLNLASGYSLRADLSDVPTAAGTVEISAMGGLL